MLVIMSVVTSLFAVMTVTAGESGLNRVRRLLTSDVTTVT